MTQLSNTIASGLFSSYRDSARRVHALCENLSEEQFWTKPYPYGNSFGNLTLHITGNLNYYIGTQIAKTGYVRDRESEFTAKETGSKAEVLRLLDDAVEMVLATLEKQTVEDWSSAYKAEGASDTVKDRFSIFLRCAVHFHHHVGQMIYLEKEFSR
jgi:uncharacterized damage-inducible protein DinB